MYFLLLMVRDVVGIRQQAVIQEIQAQAEQGEATTVLEEEVHQGTQVEVETEATEEAAEKIQRTGGTGFSGGVDEGVPSQDYAWRHYADIPDDPDIFVRSRRLCLGRAKHG
ncbi:hypothetical protein AK812_SmicGene13988 [Symbiodinium microadriaticum]|uniref:Uncharacterized protein n=1 Tax=Symbiodinium microadriaticum TaxID=2951 RepID=A0A1Q9E6R9_SYMMI|nr:hypothetical protein AK812_SmicGene13988 [Symbiodinium microadriaticum]